MTDTCKCGHAKDYQVNGECRYDHGAGHICGYREPPAAGKTDIDAAKFAAGFHSTEDLGESCLTCMTAYAAHVLAEQTKAIRAEAVRERDEAVESLQFYADAQCAGCLRLAVVEKDNERLKAENATALAALRHYADESQWYEGDGGTFGIYGVTEFGDSNGYDIARKAIAEVESENKPLDTVTKTIA